MVSLKISSCRNTSIWGEYFIMCDLIYFIVWNVIRLDGRSVVMTFLFDWMSLLFEAFVFIISSLVILYRADTLQPESKNLMVL